MPSCSRCSFTWPMLTSSRWNIPAARAACTDVSLNTTNECESELVSSTGQYCVVLSINNHNNCEGYTHRLHVVDRQYHYLPCEKCSGRPAPLEAITGMRTLFCTALTRGISYPWHCPSMLIQFSMISPAPKASHTYRYDICDDSYQRHHPLDRHPLCSCLS